MSGECDDCFEHTLDCRCNPNESLFDLIVQAQALLLDRSREEAELIYYIAKMEPDLRAAIIIAYDELFKYHDELK